MFSMASAAVIKANPQFAALLDDLRRSCIGDDGVSVTREAQLVEALRRCDAEKQEYMSKAAVLSELEHLVTFASESELNEKERRAIDSSLLHGIAQTQIMHSPAELQVHGGVLSLASTDMDAHSPPHWKGSVNTDLERKVAKVVRDNLAKRLASIREFASIDGFDGREISLAEHLEQRAAVIASKRKELLLLRTSRAESVAGHLKVLKETIQTLLDLITQYKCSLYFEKNAALDGYIHSFVQSIGLKLRSIYYELLLTVYSHETIETFHKMRRNLESRIADAKRHLVELSSQLEKYKYVSDPEFEKLVAVYGEVLANIDQTQEDLLRLRE